MVPGGDTAAAAMTRDQRRAWHEFVLASRELRATYKVVLLALETFADYPAGTNARPGVNLLMERTGQSNRTVREGLDAGEALTLIVQTARANPKAGRAAVFRLLPVSSGAATPVETSAEDVSSGAATPVESASQDVSTGTPMPVENGDGSTGHQRPVEPVQPARFEFQAARSRSSSGAAAPPTNPVPNQLHQSNVVNSPWVGGSYGGVGENFAQNGDNSASPSGQRVAPDGAPGNEENRPTEFDRCGFCPRTLTTPDERQAGICAPCERVVNSGHVAGGN